MQNVWLAELYRILKAGGVLVITIYGKAASNDLDEEGRRVLQIHGFVHQRSSKLKGLLPDWYQTTWHSQEYIVNRLSAWFDNVRYFRAPGGQQDIVAARKSGFHQ